MNTEKKLHDSHGDYPLCPEKLVIRLDMLSKQCSDVTNKYGIKFGGVNKLVPNLRDKIKYVVIKYVLGMKFIKVHRILKFKQCNWLKEYMEFNTQKRKESTDEFNKIFKNY